MAREGRGEMSVARCHLTTPSPPSQRSSPAQNARGVQPSSTTAAAPACGPAATSSRCARTASTAVASSAFKRRSRFSVTRASSAPPAPLYSRRRTPLSSAAAAPLPAAAAAGVVAAESKVAIVRGALVLMRLRCCEAPTRRRGACAMEDEDERSAAALWITTGRARVKQSGSIGLSTFAARCLGGWERQQWRADQPGQKSACC